MSKEERVKAFLAELKELSDKYNITIDGCGCCGSPWLLDTEAEEILGKKLFCNSENEYSITPNF